MDEDAHSAPAGIPTCRHTALVTAPAGIFLSHQGANLMKSDFSHGVIFIFRKVQRCGRAANARFDHLQSGGGARQAPRGDKQEKADRASLGFQGTATAEAAD